MTPFTTVVSRLAVLDQANVDTDQIIPARYLREPRGAGYDAFLFHDLPEVRAAVLGAGVLLAGDNFGCGSSREGAVYALVDAGVRCVIAPSFGDIFAGNAGKNGLLLLTLPAAATEPLRGAAKLEVDLEGQRLVAGNTVVPFEIEPFRKRMLTEGLDDIGMTLAQGRALDDWRARDEAARPWVAPAA